MMKQAGTDYHVLRENTSFKFKDCRLVGTCRIMYVTATHHFVNHYFIHH